MAILLLVGAVAADLASKTATFDHHRAMQGVYGAEQPLVLGEVGSLQLSLVRQYNTGMAFDLLQEGPGNLALLIGIRGLFLAWLLWFWHANRHGSPARLASISLLIAGVLGNLADNLWTYEPAHPHAVRDFLLVSGPDWRFPAFNLADTWVTIGAAWLLWTLWAELRSRNRRPRRDSFPC